MSSIITGLGSGLDINGWVSQLVAAKQNSTVKPLEIKLKALTNKSNAVGSLKSKFSALETSLKSFTDTIYGSSNDMWAKTDIKSSNDSYATATSSGSVAASKVDLFIEQIATATTAKSAHSLGTVSKENLENTKFTSLANGQAKAGTFSMFLNGKEFQIDIQEEDTLKDVMDKINTSSQGKIQASVDEKGNFSIKAYKEDPQGTFVQDDKATLTLGSAGDGSNLASALKLHTKEGTYGLSSSYPISSVKTDGRFGNNESGLGEIKFFNQDGTPSTSGKISINGIDIEVDEDTTINGLISKINGNTDAKVKASYDSLTNKLILTSTETGESNISLSEEGTNLLNVLGLTESSQENEVIATGSQTLGQNAIVHINGNKVVSNSNTITGESSGITNLSITVKKPTSDFSGDNKDEKSVSLDIEPNYDGVKEALSGFVKAYNDVVATTKTMTSSEGVIGHDASLNSILSGLKGVTSQVSSNDGAFKMLAEIGITSSKTNVNELTIDEEKLDKVLKEDFESVKSLLSDGYTSKKDNGIFDGMLSQVKDVLDFNSGYFKNETDSIDSQIKSMNKRIESANSKLFSYETRITKQFNQMDATIANLNAQLATFTSYIH